MTATTTDRAQELAPVPAPPPRPEQPRHAAPAPGAVPVASPVARALGTALCLLALLTGGFLLYLGVLSGVSEARTQENLFKTFRGELAAGLAPVGPTSAGRPVAVLTVPRIGLRAVVVEGTAGGQLLSGPGHRSDTPLPGQPGASVLLGRRSVAGAPFGELDRLRAGDRITVATGQSGDIRYQVTGVRDSRQPGTVGDGSPTLTLVTADPPRNPTHSLIVTARLVSPVLAAAGPRPALTAEQRSLAADRPALLAVVLWGQLLVLLAVATAWTYVRWARWPAYVVSTPVLLAVLWNVYEGLARLLPNVL